MALTLRVPINPPVPSGAHDISQRALDRIVLIHHARAECVEQALCALIRELCDVGAVSCNPKTFRRRQFTALQRGLAMNGNVALEKHAAAIEFHGGSGQRDLHRLAIGGPRQILRRTAHCHHIFERILSAFGRANSDTTKYPRAHVI